MKPLSILAILLMAPLLSAQQPAPAADREKGRAEPMLTDLSKYSRDQLLSYAAGLDLPDNPIRALYPKYLELKAEIDALNNRGLGQQHPLVMAKTKEFDALTAQLDKALVAFQPKLDKAQQRLADTVKAKVPTRSAVPAPAGGIAQLEAEKRKLEAQLAALLKLRDEPLCDFAATLDVPDNAIPTLYPHYLERKKDYENIMALGLTPDHPTAREKLQQLDAIRAQLDDGIAALRDSYRAKLNLANARLEQARAATPRAAGPPAAPPAGLRAEQARLAAQLKALSSLSGEALLIFAGNLGLAANPVPELHRRLTEATLQIADLRAEGLADDHPKVAANNARLKALNQQLQTVIDGLKEALRANLTVVEAQLNAERKHP